ncbi:MAG: XTP/dITP diphosphatase [Promethearchaeota archaeon]
MNTITLHLSFLTGNTHKFQEVKVFIESSGLDAVITQKNVPLIEIQTDSIEEVAVHKVESVGDSIQGNYFVEDAGFFIDKLKDFPGVFSSYIQEMIGNEGVLKLMKDVTERDASFRSVIALKLENTIHTFHGRVDGKVSDDIKGTQGFGYDPIFIPDGLDQTFAEISMENKNSMSHRIHALQQMCDFLLEKEKN